MLTPAAKRRRAEAASATLSRPFRSPAVRGPRSSQLADETAPQTASPQHKRPRQSSLSGQPPGQLKKQRPASLPPPPPPAPLSLDSLVGQFTLELDAGDKLIKEVQESARGAKEKQETRQAKAARARDGSQDDEMPALIAKWREAGRLAAEEVFEFVAKRVAGAGGIRAWRAMAAPPPPEQDWEHHRQRDEDGEEYNTRGDGEERGEEEGEDEEEEEEETEQSQDFTMAMMLASLNVEPDLLGYDEAEERWKD